MSTYESKAKTTSISASSKVTLKIRDSFYSYEYMETRGIPDEEGVDLTQEKQLLWDDVIKEVDDQIDELKELFKK